jgi:hypothetical protein
MCLLCSVSGDRDLIMCRVCRAASIDLQNENDIEVCSLCAGPIAQGERTCSHHPQITTCNYCDKPIRSINVNLDPKDPELFKKCAICQWVSCEICDADHSWIAYKDEHFCEHHQSLCSECNTSFPHHDDFKLDDTFKCLKCR